MEKIDLIMKNFIAELGYEPANAMFARINSGKKLRSKLLLKIAGESEQSLKICAIIELIHLASLLHDDVIDDADTRRGSPSINASFGTKNAVMLGDILYSKGFCELSKFPHEIAGEISGAVSKLSVGEMMDVDLSAKFNEDKSAYETMIYYKTAVLIEAAAAVGAMLAGLDARNFKIYGKNLGLAFQIIDDILDVTQDAATLETEIGFLEISVLFRTSAAHLKANSIALPSFAPHLPLARANLYASFSCPAICVSPITRLSSELATAKRWCTAPLSS